MTSHEAWGVGVYCFFRDSSVKANSAIEAPAVPGVKFHNLTTIWLDGKPESEIAHIINGLGQSGLHEQVLQSKSADTYRVYDQAEMTVSHR